MTRPSRRCAMVVVALVLAGAARGQDGVGPGVGVFEIPGLVAARAEAARQAQGGAADRAEALLGALAARYPKAALPQADLAQVLAAAGRDRAAVAALGRAADLGLDIGPVLGGAAFRALAARLPGDAGLAALAARPAPQQRAVPKPLAIPVGDGVAPVRPANTVWDGAAGVLDTRFAFPERSAAPVIRPDPGPVARLLTLWHAQGTAAGNLGDLYDNRDAGHSALDPALLPQLARTVYGPEAVAAGVHYGLNTQVRFNAITLGNSSTAVAGGPYWRSQPRLALTRPGGAQALWRNYAGNQIYVFPEHRDHDPALGDMFPANTPYVVVSQGSSGSDRPFLAAIGTILAALRPDTKARAREAGLIAPTVQMILRRGMAGVRRQDDYFTGAAHPSVFDATDIALDRMVRLAQDLGPGDLPPMVRLRVVEETGPGDTLGEGLGERLFDTPSAIARVVHGLAATRRMIVTATDTVDPNGRPLTYRWAVLRGDAGRIRIRPLQADGGAVELTLPWHARAPVPGRPDLASDRVDIGVFALNGAVPSAPGFVSMLYPGDQARDYDAAGRLRSVDYARPGVDRASIDPILFPRRDWRDVYDYDAAGRLTGWTRARGAEVTRYTADGARVLRSDALGRPEVAERVAYPLTDRPDGARLVAETPTGQFLAYDYAGPDDRVGRARPLAVPP